MDNTTITLNQFLDEFKDAIARKVVEEYPPAYSPAQRDMFREKAHIMLRSLYPAQLDTANALTVALRNKESAMVVGEMGTGKTIISIATAHFSNFKRVLVMCPPHLVRKWTREIEATLPDVEVLQLKSVSDMRQVMDQKASNPNKQQWYILSRERAKLSYQWKPAFLQTRSGSSYILRCPACGQLLVDKDRIPLNVADLKRKKHKCIHCQEPLWQASNKGPRRYALADLIKKKYKNFFDLLVIDECHEYKGKGTSQGFAAGALAAACKKTLALTGTLFGGYSSTLFHLLYRLTSGIKKEFAHNEETRWISQYGIVEKITRKPDDYESNLSSKGKKYHASSREKPGLSPVVLPNYLLDRTAFIRLPDLALDLPPYHEKVIACPMTEEQSLAYFRLARQLHDELVAQLCKGSKSLLSTYLQSLLSYPDRCYEGEMVLDPKTKAPIADAPALDSKTIYPKEKKLIDICRNEKREGRKVLVYATHTDRRDITGRLKDILEQHGLQTLVLKSNTIKAEQREEWIKNNLNTIDVLIVHPRLVQTGLDLVDFPTIVSQEVEYSVYTLRQASRRSWRIGQTQPVKVYYLIYEDTIQEQALKLIALKHKCSLAIEGELLDDGLAAYNSTDNDFFYELARNIVDNVRIDESIDNLWAQIKSAEQNNSVLLADILTACSNRPTIEELRQKSIGLRKTAARRKSVHPGQLSLWRLQQ
jgi:SNF2 family DNA or RNA helicase